MRKYSVNRKTKETEIEVNVVLDGKGKSDIHTGIGFLDHMLDQLSKHSLIDIRIKAKGDLHVDLHHTTEDSALALGEAFTKALGTGIGKGISLKDIQVFNDSSGKPNIKARALTNNFLKRKIKRNKYKIYLSLSDDDPWAQATVIISYN